MPYKIYLDSIIDWQHQVNKINYSWSFYQESHIWVLQLSKANLVYEACFRENAGITELYYFRYAAETVLHNKGDRYKPKFIEDYKFEPIWRR